MLTSLLVIFGIFLEIFCWLAEAAGPITSTVVGGGAVGSQSGVYYGDGGSPELARLNNPEDVALDSHGNIYIADKVNNRIRMVSVSESERPSVVTTVAGNGKAKFSGDGGLATSASLFFPAGVSIYKNELAKSLEGIEKSDDVLLIADSWNNRVRYVNLRTNMISTLAGNGDDSFGGDGGTAIEASLNNPVAAVPLHIGCGVNGCRTGDAELFVDSILIADSFNHRIRRVSLTDGTITTFAGNGKTGYCGDGESAVLACLHRPYGIAVDSKHTFVIIADHFGNRIRKVSLETGLISTIAGVSGLPGFGGDGEDASKATLYNPIKIALDCHNNVYFSDYYNQKIRMIDAKSNIISTIAGKIDRSSKEGDFAGDGLPSSESLFHAPMGLILDSSNNILIADSSNHRIRKISAVSSPCKSLVIEQDEF